MPREENEVLILHIKRSDVPDIKSDLRTLLMNTDLTVVTQEFLFEIHQKLSGRR